jgi:hypothetical protein
MRVAWTESRRHTHEEDAEIADAHASVEGIAQSVAAEIRDQNIPRSASHADD